MKRPKKEPIGWIGPAKATGRGTSLGKGRWRVIDSTGQWIASGFTTRAYALRWIDSFNLIQAGHDLSKDDHRWLLLHWYPARQRTRTRSPSAPTESGKTTVLITKANDEGVAAAGDSRNKSGQV